MLQSEQQVRAMQIILYIVYNCFDCSTHILFGKKKDDKKYATVGICMFIWKKLSTKQWHFLPEK